MLKLWKLDQRNYLQATCCNAHHVFVEMQGNEPLVAKKEGRMVYYTVADDDGNVDEGHEETSFVFKGNGLEDLTLNLEEQTGINDIIVCLRNPLNGKLFPLQLALPPNNTTMHVVVVPPTSKG